MIISDEGLDFIKSAEGLRLEMYLDSGGVPTIGYGHTKYAANMTRISVRVAEELLREDLEVFERAVNNGLDGTSVAQHQFDALVSLAYNIGSGAFLRSTLLRKLKAGKIKEAADQFLVWKKVKGKTVQGLLNRRRKERNIFLNDHPQN